MPNKAMKFCSKCNNMAIKDGLCTAHYKERNRDRERARDNKYYGLYHDSRWDGTYGLRRQQLIDEPLCRICRKENRLTVATVADHIVPHKGDPNKFFNKNNLQSLCEEHHNIKTANEDGGFGRPQGEGKNF